jgi:hypothetical protein
MNCTLFDVKSQYTLQRLLWLSQEGAFDVEKALKDYLLPMGFLEFSSLEGFNKTDKCCH